MRGTGATIVVWTGRCGPDLEAALARNRTAGGDLIFYAPNADAACVAAAGAGALDGLLVTSLADPDSAATAALGTLLGAADLPLTAAAVRAASAFVLFARAAQGCGAGLDRDCVLARMQGTRRWTAGGLHAVTDPGGNLPSACSSLWVVAGGELRRFDPPEDGDPFLCDPAAVVPVATSAARDAQLDEQRVARRYEP